MVSFNIEDLEAALRQLQITNPQEGEDPAAFTTRDVSKLRNVPEHTASLWIKRLCDAGRLEITEKAQQIRTGGWRRVPAYKLKGACSEGALPKGAK